jgi:hypothetical protein
MAQTQNGAANVAHPVRENDQARQQVGREHKGNQAAPQDRLAREAFRECEARL